MHIAYFIAISVVFHEILKCKLLFLILFPVSTKSVLLRKFRMGNCTKAHFKYSKNYSWWCTSFLNNWQWQYYKNVDLWKIMFWQKQKYCFFATSSVKHHFMHFYLCVKLPQTSLQPVSFFTENWLGLLLCYLSQTLKLAF